MLNEHSPLLAFVILLTLFPYYKVREAPPPTPVKQEVKAANPVHWMPCVLTQYAQKFEGRKCADGSTFRHGNLTLASRGVPLGRIVVLRYGSQVVTVKSTDRGRLPLHRSGRPQFDVTRAVSRRLGLYKRELGRRAEWRMK